MCVQLPGWGVAAPQIESLIKMNKAENFMNYKRQSKVISFNI